MEHSTGRGFTFWKHLMAQWEIEGQRDSTEAWLADRNISKKSAAQVCEKCVTECQDYLTITIIRDHDSTDTQHWIESEPLR